MHKDIREDVFDLVFTAALEEFVDGESSFFSSSHKEYAPPKNGLNRIRREIKAKKHGNSTVVVYLQRVAVVFLVAATLFAGLMALNVEVRASVKKIVTEWFDDHVRIVFDGGNDEGVDPTKDIYSFEIGYIPDNYELFHSNEEEEAREYTYISDDNSEVMFVHIYRADSVGYSVDVERTEFEPITVNGREALIFYERYNSAAQFGAITFEDSGYAFVIEGDISKEEMISIAENIK